MIDTSDTETHLSILGNRELCCLVAKNYNTNRVETAWLPRDKIVQWTENMNKQQYTVWISVNAKEKGNDTIEGVRSLDDLYCDIDARRKDKSLPATEQELIEAFAIAEKFKGYLKQEYGACGHLAFSGNGWHLHFPLLHHLLPNKELRHEVNLKLQIFIKKATKRCGVEIDKVYDLRRCSTLIGSLNLKIPDKPLRTAWYNPSNETFDVEKARQQNKKLLGAILNANVTVKVETSELESRQVKGQETFEELVRADKKLRDLYKGDWKKYGYKSRSEAEQAVLFKLVQGGFSNDEVSKVMETCQIGKWQERDAAYRTHSLKKARDYVSKLFIYLKNLKQIEDPKLVMKMIKVRAIVSSTNTSYAVPSEVIGEWEDEDGERHEETRSIAADSVITPKIIGSSSRTKYKLLSSLFPATAKNLRIKDTHYRTVYKLRVSPPVFTLEEREGKIVDEKGCEYKAYDLYIVTREYIAFPPSSSMILHGKVIPDPKKQTITLLVTKVEFPEDVQGFNIEVLKTLQKVLEGKTVSERIDWILNNFEKWAKIVKRLNVAFAGFLAFFSARWLEFDDEVKKGWANVGVMGDTTTAKSETIKKLIKLLKAGTLITAETASSVGLTGAATQKGKEGWMVDWGFLVLMNGKLLAIDGAHKLSKYRWSELDEADRSGVVTIVKAAKGRAPAETRQIKLLNPVDLQRKRETKNLDDFLYSVQSLATVFMNTSLARLDLCVFTNTRDVKPEEINVKLSQEYDKRIHLLSEQLKWAWNSKFKIEFTEEAEEEIWKSSTHLQEMFGCSSIPLVSADMKWKLVRLSTSLAILTLSTEDFKVVIVTKAHVEYIVKFLTDEYRNAGLHALALQTKYEVVDKDDVKSLIKDINEKTRISVTTIPKILNFIAVNTRVKREILMYRFRLARDNQLNPLVQMLQNRDLIKRGKGYYALPKLNQVVKVLGKLGRLGSTKKSTPSIKKKELKENSGAPHSKAPKIPKIPTFEEWKDRCPICGLVIGKGRERERLEPSQDGVDAHKSCVDRLEIYNKEKTWRKYAIEYQIGKEINELIEREREKEIEKEITRRRGKRPSPNLEKNTDDSAPGITMLNWCPICGSKHSYQGKVRLPPRKDEMYAHEVCYKEKGVEGKPWWEYAIERERREANR